VRALGLLKQRGRQRTDRLALLTHARDLQRVELVFGTMRVALGALPQADPAWLTRDHLHVSMAALSGLRSASALRDGEAPALPDRSGALRASPGCPNATENRRLSSSLSATSTGD